METGSLLGEEGEEEGVSEGLKGQTVNVEKTRKLVDIVERRKVCSREHSLFDRQQMFDHGVDGKRKEGGDILKEELIGMFWK